MKALPRLIWNRPTSLSAEATVPFVVLAAAWVISLTTAVALIQNVESCWPLDIKDSLPLWRLYVGRWALDAAVTGRADVVDLAAVVPAYFFLAVVG